MKLILFAVLILSGEGLSLLWADVDYQARGWAATCTGCHGTEGRSIGAIPSIAGMEEKKFAQKMLYYKSDKAQATIMHQHARGYTLDQINRMARYFRNQTSR